MKSHTRASGNKVMVKIPHMQIYLRKLFLVIFVSFFKIVCLLFGSYIKRFYLWSVKQ